MPLHRLVQKNFTVNYSYNRPNGSREFTILPEYGVDDVSVGENYWAAAENASDVVAAWNRYDFFKGADAGQGCHLRWHWLLRGRRVRQLLGDDLYLRPRHQ